MSPTVAAPSTSPTTDAPAGGLPPTPSLPPGPRLPVLAQTALAWNLPGPFLTRCRRRYGPVFTMRSLPWGRAIVINDATLVKQVFTGDAAIFHAGEGNSMLAPVLGERSVLVTDEDEHLQARKRLLPPFHGEAVRAFEEVVARVTREEIAAWPVGQPFPLHPSMRRLTFEVIMQAVIGDSGGERSRALREVLPRSVDLNIPTMLMWVHPTLERFGRWRRYRETVAEAHRLLAEEIAARRTDPMLEERGDALSQLVRAGEIGDEELRDQIMTLLLAGHETSATALAWTFERMLRHPAVLERAREGEDRYLDAVVSETLRVRPVIAAVLRQLTEPVELGGRVLPAGVTVMPAIKLMHDDPTLFSAPLSFRPERFLDSEEANTYTFIPFGGGRRRCLGAAFASFEMRVVLRTILAETELRADRVKDEGVRSRHITLVPARGARVVRTA